MSVVTVERHFDAPIERVFAAWTDPSRLRHWFHSSADTHVASAEIDLRVGGRYRVEIKEPEDTMVVFGRYLELDPPHLLEFTWEWEVSSIQKDETTVRVELESTGEGTRLRLTHSRLSSERSTLAHKAGWDGVLSSLASHLENTK